MTHFINFDSIKSTLHLRLASETILGTTSHAANLLETDFPNLTFLLRNLSNRVHVTHERLHSLGLSKDLATEVDYLNTTKDLGVTIHTGHIAIHIGDPAMSGKVPPTQKAIEIITSHELHHLYRNLSMDVPRTHLIDHMVTEGLAKHFEAEVTGHNLFAPNGVWGNDLKELAQKAGKSLTAPLSQQEKIAWLYGDKSQGIPVGSIHRLGYAVMYDYLKETGQTAAKLALIPPSIIAEFWKAREYKLSDSSAQIPRTAYRLLPTL